MATAANAVPDKDACAVRTLTPEEMEHLQKDQTLVSEFKQNKLEKEAEKNWDLFYKRNTTKFFKDRHWTKREFEELVGREEDAGRRKVLFEVGCGVGNFIFPLLEEDESKSLFVYACDFSKRAVQFVKDHQSYDENRCCVFHADITSGLSDNVPNDSVDIATMIFVLSAIHPDKMLTALSNVLQTLKPGGVLLFRDYGLYDHAMLRFAPGHKLADCFYVRQDGTRAYYFPLEFLQELAEKAGYRTGQIQYVYRDTINKKEGLCVPRIFVQAKFLKPVFCADSGVWQCERDSGQTGGQSMLAVNGLMSQCTVSECHSSQADASSVSVGSSQHRQQCQGFSQVSSSQQCAAEFESQQTADS
ncbi:tRNA N(3)-cytidine methyltransferase METTL6-like [Babylonia areolata]|uniref:tRNA N(3)-cytidine methyltransferase METTL6-like n=1 Tax=Babylonia areolata TaxID=304850 RepID=UPI003FD62BD6